MRLWHTPGMNKSEPSFATTALVVHLADYIAQHFPDALPPEAGRADPLDQFRIELSEKRILVAALARAGGEQHLLQAGRSFSLTCNLPTAEALIRAPDLEVLAGKWMRFERYHHSHNRTQIEITPLSWDCTRHATEGAGPLPVENMLIAGALDGVMARFTGRAARLAPQAVDWSRFTLTAAVPGPASPEAGPTPDADRLEEMLLEDLARGWELADVAEALHMSTRTLQRRLKDRGLSFSRLIRRLRVEAASRLLCNSGLALADIGYACGFSDQAHFQREFKRQSGMTPRRLRELSA